jgi:hypothetical protein
MSEPAASIEERISAVLGAEESTPDAPPEAPPEAREEVVEAPPEAAEQVEEVPQGDENTEAPESDEGDTLPAELEAFAEAINADPSELYNIVIPYTKNGERHEFTLGELKDKAQDFEEANSIREQADSALAQYNQRLAEIDRHFEEQVTTTANYLQHAEQMLLAEMQAINWQQLEQQNPGEWARLSETFRRKQGELQRMKNEAGQVFQAQQRQNAEIKQRQQQELLQREQAATLRAIPEWRDQQTAESERSQLVEYMRENGFTADEINSVTDHRVLVALRKAWMLDKNVKTGDVAKKKVVKIAKKVVKPGGRQTAREAQHDRERAVTQAHRENPKSMDAAARRIQLRLGR